MAEALPPRRFRNLTLGLLGVLLLPPFLRHTHAGVGMLGPALFVLLVTRSMVSGRSSRLLRAVQITAMAAVALRGARINQVVQIDSWGLSLGLHLLTVLGFGFVVYEVLRAVLAAGEVNADKLYGAVAAYLLIGLAFASAYEALQFCAPDAFHVPDRDVTTPDILIYFSLVTLSTVGYGDVVAQLPEARVLSVFEAILGQLYLAILMARLVGLHLSQSGTRPASSVFDAPHDPPSSEAP